MISKQVRIKKVNEPQVLVLSNKYDYSTDYICIELEKRDIPYLRLNRDMFDSYEIVVDLQCKQMTIVINATTYLISDDILKAVYFRAPVFLRNAKPYSVNEQLERGQWSSFIRNLIIFDKAKWINHPVKTYRAENKIFQLQVAADVGLEVPHTWCGNVIPEDLTDEKYIVKSLDTALFYDNGLEMFTYSSIVSRDELQTVHIHEAPVIIQQFIRDKIDIRVTFIDGRMFPVSIMDNMGGITGDWRKTPKEILRYSLISIPEDVQKKLCLLMKEMELSFGGIDLALTNDKYYFIEANPTGEWGWLKKLTGCPIDEAIVDSFEV